MQRLQENGHLLDEIIDNASELPLEYQEFILAIAKGMAFSRSQSNKESDASLESDKTA
ncbi:MAG: hypothetical protein FWE11_02330 [Defluviitaleaceae bacterium]|nr:hypothetical protein [Defluviitaleaceae bacterium]